MPIRPLLMVAFAAVLPSAARAETTWYVAPGGCQPSDCCYAHGMPGCDDSDCETDVCFYDPFCCILEWDETCAANAAENLCTFLCASCEGTQSAPFCCIQTGIDVAVDGDEIIAAPGTYVESIDFHGKSITVRSMDPDDPGVVAATVIDGGGALQVVTCSSGEGPTTSLRGFTITNGWADGSSLHGGGMVVSGGSSPHVADCTFLGNFAWFGGGMAVLDGNPTVERCTFEGNTTMAVGGALYVSVGNTTVDSCTFRANTSQGGGAVYIDEFPDPTVTVIDSTFCGNVPDDFDGGPVTLSGEIHMSRFCPIPVCPADTNGDGDVGVADFLELLARWGPCP
jgi:hypothetical protein